MNVFGKIERLGVTRAFRFHHLDNCGNHFAGFFNHHRVADSDVFAFDFVLVVQCRARNCAAAHQHWLQRRDRRENSGAPDLNHDVVQTRLDAFRRVFVSNRPARRFGSESKPLALRERVHFDYCAIGLIRKIRPDLVEVPDRFENFVDRIGQPPFLVRRAVQVS